MKANANLCSKLALNTVIWKSFISQGRVPLALKGEYLMPSYLNYAPPYNKHYVILAENSCKILSLQMLENTVAYSPRSCNAPSIILYLF